MGGCSVQSGSTSWTSDTGYTLSVPLSSIDTTKSFLVYTVRQIGGTGTAFAGYITGYINSSTEIVFIRQYQTTEDWAIDWFVVTFADGMLVQRGSADVGTTTVDVPLATNVDTDKTFAISNAYQPATGYNPPLRQHTVRADITASNNLALISYENTAKPKIYWQVVQYNNCRVQKTTKSFTTETSGTSTLAVPVPVDKTFITMTGRHNDDQNKFQRYWHCRLTATDTLTYERVTSDSYAAEFVSYAITFTDNARVQHYKTAIAVDTNVTDVTPSPVIGNTAKAWIIGENHHDHSAMDPESISDQQWRVAVGARITAYNNVRLERATGCTLPGIPAGNYYWELVEHLDNMGLFSLLLTGKEQRGAS